MKTLTVDHVETVLHDEGEGTPILFLHGVPDSGEMWLPLFEKLKGQFRCLAPDMPGLGRSKAPRDFDLSLENRGRWVEHLVEAIGLDEPVHLVCHDFGGPSALAWAVQYPERIKSIVPMATCFHREWKWHSLGKMYRAPLMGEVTTALQTAPLIGWPLFLNEMRKGGKNLPRQHVRETYDRINRDVAYHTLRLYRATPSECFIDWDTRLYALVEQRPTLALWSALDPYVPVEFARLLEGHGAKVHVFEDVGHWMPVEAVDRVAKHLLDFYNAQ